MHVFPEVHFTVFSWTESQVSVYSIAMCNVLIVQIYAEKSNDIKRQKQKHSCILFLPNIMVGERDLRTPHSVGIIQCYGVLGITSLIQNVPIPLKGLMVQSERVA